MATEQNDADLDQYELTDYELGFLQGVFAARGIVDPARADLREAIGLLLQRRALQSDTELN